MNTEKVKKRNLRPWIIGLGIIGVVLITFLFEWGMTFIAIAGLLAISEFIRERLRRIGAERWALGSIIVSLGFLMLSVVLIGYAWSIFDQFTQVILGVVSIIIMVLGYFTEYWDINEKLLKFFARAKFQFQKLSYQFREKFLRSGWTILSLITGLVLIASYFIPLIGTTIGIIIPNEFLSPQLTLLLLIIILLTIEFRSFIVFFGGRGLELISIIFNGLIRRFVHLRSLLISFGYTLIDFVKALWRFIKRTILFVQVNTYVFGIISFLVFAFAAYYRQDEILGSFSFLILLLTLSLFFSKYESAISNRVRSTQQSAYRTSFRVRNFLSRNKLMNCPHCTKEILINYNYCRHCNEPLPRCLICKNTILKGEEEDACSSCENHFHSNHIEKWIEIRSSCPVCRNEWIPVVT